MENTESFLNPYLALINPVFLLIQLLHQEDRGKNLAAEYGDSCRAAMENFTNQAISKNLPSTEIEYVKYAIAAFIDEAISTSAWQWRYEWVGYPLQLQYFAEHLAGEGFFKRLEQLRQEGAHSLNVLEVYFFCLRFGFAGMYGVNDREKLLALTTELQNYLAVVRSHIANRLAAEEITKEKEAAFENNSRYKIASWFLASIVILIIILIYAACELLVSHQAKIALEKINSLTISLPQKNREL